MESKREEDFQLLKELFETRPSEVIETLLREAEKSQESCTQIVKLLSPLLTPAHQQLVFSNGSKTPKGKIAPIQSQTIHVQPPSLSLSSEGIRLRKRRINRSPRSKDEMYIQRGSVSLKGKFRKISITDSPQVQFFKCKKSADIGDILKEPQLAAGFREFLVKKYCEENYDFWKEANRFKNTFSTLKPEDALRLATNIYKTFIQSNSQREINISSSLRKELDIFFQSPNVSELTSKLFQNVHCEITQLLTYEWFPSFKEDELFIGWFVRYFNKQKKIFFSRIFLTFFHF